MLHFKVPLTAFLQSRHERDKVDITSFQTRQQPAGRAGEGKLHKGGYVSSGAQLAQQALQGLQLALCHWRRLHRRICRLHHESGFYHDTGYRKPACLLVCEI